MKVMIKKEKGVSEVVGSLLVLAITVTLFSSVFYYVTTIPAPTQQTYSQFNANLSIVWNKTGNYNVANINIKNIGGESLQLWRTLLVVQIDNNYYRHLLSDPLIAKQLMPKSVFAAGSQFNYNSSWDTNSTHLASATYMSNISIYLFDTVTHQVIWSETLQGVRISTPIVIGLSTSPSPLINQQPATFTAIVVYPSAPSEIGQLQVYLNLSALNLGHNVTMNYAGNSQFQYSTGSSVVKTTSKVVPTYVTIITPSGNKTTTTVFVSISTNIQNVNVKVTQFNFENPAPLHGSNDIASVVIQNNGTLSASFLLNVFDKYPNGTVSKIQSNYGLGVNSTFYVGVFSTITIQFIWVNVGGNGPVAGNNKIILELSNITTTSGIKQQPNIINYTNYVYIKPKILLVNEQSVLGGSPQDVNLYYLTMFEYTGYQVDEVSISEYVNPSLKGYDVVVWFTGNNSNGISSSQMSLLTNFYNGGGKILLISSAISGSSALNIDYNTTVNINSSGMGINNFQGNAIYYSFMSPYFVPNPSFGSVTLTPLMYININQIPHIVSGNATNTQSGRIIVIGFEFARLMIYQQDFLLNKFMMWLDNITTNSGNQLILSDIMFSTNKPLFYQDVNISFVISNLSPQNFSTTLEVLINNQYYGTYLVPTITKNGGYQIVNITWKAVTLGKNVIVGIVDPNHFIPQINYALDTQSALINNIVEVQFSALVIWDHSINDKNNITSLLSGLNDLKIHYGFIKFVPYTSSSFSGNLSNYFLSFNLIILDFNSTGILNSTLTYAISNYYSTYLQDPTLAYSIIFIGSNINNALVSGGYFGQGFDLELSFSYPTFNSINGNYALFGINYTNYMGFGFYGNNVTNSYGILNMKNTPYYVSSSQQQTLALFENSWTTTSIPLTTGSGLIMQINGLKVTVLPFNIEDISGFIQPHSLSYAPNHPIQTAKDILLLNLLGYDGYIINKPIPFVMSSTFKLSSPILMINRYYVANVNITNLGNVPTNVVLNAYDGSGLFATQTVYLPGLATVPVQFIWDPQFAALASNPRYLRVVVAGSSVPEFTTKNGNQPFYSLGEGIKPTPVYVFYDNLSTGDNWKSYAITWAYTGVNFYGGGNTLYSNEPFSTEGSVASPVYELSSGMYYTTPYPSSGLFQYINGYWGFFNNSLSGGLSLGTSYNFVGSSWDYANAYASVVTTAINIHGAKYAYLEFNAKFQLALGGEGVAVFASPNGLGSHNWIWISPIQGYPGNVNYGPIIGTGWTYPQNSADLLPAFTTVSGGENFGWQQYTFNLTQFIEAKDSAIYLRFVLILNSEPGYNMNIYGNDFFYIDNIKVVENGTTIGTGISNGDLWQRQYSNGVWSYNSTNFYPTEVDNVVSVPISLLNLVNATLNFQTKYSIYARYAYAAYPTDVPNGFRLYAGFLGQNGMIIWNQLDTRWAGEAGAWNSLWYDAKSVLSNYYTPNVYAFHQTGSDISLTGYIGLTIYLKFEVNGDNGTYFKSTSNSAINPPNSSWSSPWAAFTNVIITGNSYADLISIQNFWT